MLIHDNLYHFWSRSIGVWDSLLVKVTANWLSEQELLSLCQIHALSQPEFGVYVSWEYKKKSESGNMSWCVDANHPNLIFANKTLKHDPPSILNYQLPDANKLVITVDELEETFVLASNERRLRELRYQGKLLRRLWEQKVNTEIPQASLVTPSDCITKNGDLMKLPELITRPLS